MKRTGRTVKVPSILPRTHYRQNLRAVLLQRIAQLGDFKFEDDSWYFGRRHKDALPKGCYTVPFHKVPQQYRDWVKYFVLMSTASISHVMKQCYKIAEFLTFVHDNWPTVDIPQITREHVNRFEYFLRLQESSQNVKHSSYAALQAFFSKISDFPEMPKVVPTKDINPYKQNHRERMNDRLLDQDVIRKWDSVMKSEEYGIPLEFRTLYWLIRSFPNRITEILSMDRDCLKTFYSEYMIQIPTPKQSGGYQQVVTKTIPVIYEGHGKFVIDLIKRLQAQTEELLSRYPVQRGTKENYLFIVTPWNFNEVNGTLQLLYHKKNIQLRNWTSFHINKAFRDLSPVLNIRNKDGELIVPTTHQFRHNATTDRSYKVGYTNSQIRRLTGHKNESMQKQYTHQLVQKHKEIHLNIAGLRRSEDSPVEFRGKILNLDERTVQQLSKDPRRYLTWEANRKKGVGICSDISGCNPKGTSVHFECYACDWFVPKLEYYEDYQQEYSYWSAIVERTSKDPKRAAQFENAVRNVTFVERILTICQHGLSNFKSESIEAQINNHEEKYRWE